ncbi:hypothetical protein Csa_023888, partial [Cucumis sativus]
WIQTQIIINNKLLCNSKTNYNNNSVILCFQAGTFLFIRFGIWFRASQHRQGAAISCESLFGVISRHF